MGDLVQVQAGNNHVADEGQFTDAALVKHILDEYNHESPPPPENDICPKFGCLALKIKAIWSKYCRWLVVDIMMFAKVDGGCYSQKIS